MKYGLMLATGQLGWEATPEVAGRLWRRLRDRMASCDLDVVNLHGCKALCRFMYTEHGFVKPTMHDGGTLVHYRDVATDLWERLGKRITGRPGSRRAGAIAGWPSSVKTAEQRDVWCELVRALPLVDEWPFWTGDVAYPTPTMGYFYDKAIRHVTPGPYLWPQATSGPKPLVSDLLPSPKARATGRRNSLLPEAAVPRACVTVTQTRQERFDQALLQAAHGAARCLTIACQGLQEQRREPLTEDNLVAAYTLGRHFANSMRVPMQDCNELLLRCSPFSPEVPDSHPGRLHAAVRVMDNAWRDDAGLEMLHVLVEEMEAAGVQPAYTQRLSPGGHPRGDPSDSTSSAVAQGVGAAVRMEETEAAGVQRPCTQPLSQEGHPRGDPSDSTSSAVAQEGGAAVRMARDPSGDESVTPTSSSLAQGRGPPAGAPRVDTGEVLSPPAPPPPQVVRTRHVLNVEHRTPGPRSAPPVSHTPRPPTLCV